jgi:hypothetical protein
MTSARSKMNSDHLNFSRAADADHGTPETPVACRSTDLELLMIYALLKDRRASLIGRHHWLGNLRWFAEELDTAGHWVFRTAPIDSSECDLWRPNLLAGEPSQAIANAHDTALSNLRRGRRRNRAPRGYPECNPDNRDPRVP